MVARHLGKLSDIGYIEREKKNNITHYSPGEVFESFTTHIDWTKVVKGCKEFIRINYPSIYKKYSTLYCNKPMVTHPFSGQQLNLLEIKEETPKAVAEGLDKFDKKEEPKEMYDSIGEDSKDYKPVEEEYVENEGIVFICCFNLTNSSLSITTLFLPSLAICACLILTASVCSIDWSVLNNTTLDMNCSPTLSSSSSARHNTNGLGNNV